MVGSARLPRNRPRSCAYARDTAPGVCRQVGCKNLENSWFAGTRDFVLAITDRVDPNEEDEGIPPVQV